MESGGQRGSSHSMSIQIPTERDGILHLLQEVTLLSPARFSSRNSSANERRSQLRQYLFITTPPNFPFSSIKDFPLLCFTRLACGLPQLHVPNYNSLLLRNKPILLLKKKIILFHEITFSFSKPSSDCTPLEALPPSGSPTLPVNYFYVTKLLHNSVFTTLSPMRGSKQV